MSKNLSIPFDMAKAEEIAAEFGTPIYVYDEKGIVNTAKKLNDAFSWNSNFKNYFAVKATPNPIIMKLLQNTGMGFDCANSTELLLAEKVGASGSDLILSSNNTAEEDFQKAMELGAIINLDDISHLDFLEKVASLPDLISFRYNPGKKLGAGNEIIGHPEDAKYGMPEEHILRAIKSAKQKGVKRFGLHIMGISNSLDSEVAVRISELTFKLAMEIKRELEVEVEFVNLGGGLGIPYHPDEDEFDLDFFASGVEDNYNQILDFKPQFLLECGRYITGPHGYLVSKVRHIKNTYKQFVGLDASMQNLMRPGMYGAYHHITVLGKESEPHNATFDVTGSLCENNDKFAIDRKLPKIEIGDLVVIHDVGAHGHAMGFNYNGKLRSAEVLLKENGEVELIRRAETVEDYFRTLVW